MGNKYFKEAGDPILRKLPIIFLEILKKTTSNSVGTYCNSDKILIIFLSIMKYVWNVTGTLGMANHSGRRATRISCTRRTGTL
jgi:hypothetical protein